eukprot:gb/GECH01013485.1/.p1 GENE.gb/GECH01013485.1/~~gb/GECH01013485.1/.p1  ORF type:complete len:254 (+),score=57.25 gb/GECH01013485.1/:1-762(+)
MGSSLSHILEHFHFLSKEKNPFEGRLLSQVNEVWNQSTERHDLSHDISRLVRKIQVTRDSNIVFSGVNTKHLSKEKTVMEFIVTLALALNDQITIDNFEEREQEFLELLKEEHGLMSFLRICFQKNSRIERLLKLCNQKTISRAVIYLKDRMKEETNLHFTDLPGSWKIYIDISYGESITVTHRRSEKIRVTENYDEYYTFDWELMLHSNWNLTVLDQAKPNCVGVDFSRCHIRVPGRKRRRSSIQKTIRTIN